MNSKHLAFKINTYMNFRRKQFLSEKYKSNAKYCNPNKILISIQKFDCNKYLMDKI